MITLEQTREAIARQGLPWEAGESPLGPLVAAGTATFGLTMGGKEPAGGRGRLSEQSFAFPGETLPARVDWRDVDGDDFTTTVKSQGKCGSCVAFSTCSTMESRIKIERRDPHMDIDLSEAHLFFCGNNGSNPCDAGWNFGPALLRCREVGVGLDAAFRYNKGLHLECVDIEPVYRVPRWRRLERSMDRKTALAKRGPVIAGMHVFADFGWYRSGVYRPTTPEIVALHAICIVGYDDEAGCWIVKNSWGTAWGEGGYVRIGYGTCGIDSQFPFYDIEVEQVRTMDRDKAEMAA